ncbi:(Na+)-NQR maturation NqrM [Alkalimarinus sediminis]|uniref:(Na+)-NQR maturation NqrM n=1 Tax=Alkalimarinus sediminis TaxID=1632866 RepID=A0A9E8HP39_9ALTE|nr:(Na+)-NQR maturation NqrM [Alkalimarinus sediminis]UZW76516.1 (Na+)-NQR maturation NqrM [Alkalimarinus sediminis]
MSTFIVVFLVMGLIIIAMSVGVLMGRKPISGSCGGMASLGMDVACDICKGDKNICDDEQEKAKAKKAIKDLSYDATKS